jgi:hypothetical protein
MHDAKKDRGEPGRGPFHGLAPRAALVFAMVFLGACQAPVQTGTYRGPASAVLPERIGGGGPGGRAAGGDEDAVEEDGDDAACDDGAMRECRVFLGEHNGVTSCFEGVQICRDGTWGACGSAPLTQ